VKMVVPKPFRRLAVRAGTTQKPTRADFGQWAGRPRAKKRSFVILQGGVRFYLCVIHRTVRRSDILLDILHGPTRGSRSDAEAARFHRGVQLPMKGAGMYRRRILGVVGVTAVAVGAVATQASGQQSINFSNNTQQGINQNEGGDGNIQFGNQSQFAGNSSHSTSTNSQSQQGIIFVPVSTTTPAPVVVGSPGGSTAGSSTGTTGAQSPATSSTAACTSNPVQVNRGGLAGLLGLVNLAPTGFAFCPATSVGVNVPVNILSRRVA